MNFQFYLEKLRTSEEFKKFKNNYPKSFLCSSFFVIDRAGKDNKIHLDYFDKKENKIFSFQLEDGIKNMPIDKIGDDPLELSDKIDFDLKEIEEIIDEQIVKNNIKNKVEKMILALQTIDGKSYLFGTIFVSSLGLLKISIILPEKKVESFEKKSFFDIVNVLKKPKK